MKLIATTSDHFLESTLLMLESFRCWHPQTPVVVYALDRGWTSDMTDRLTALAANVQIIVEHDPRHRTGNHGGAVHAGWKLDLLAEQQEPFVYLDSDILVLQPLNELWQAVTEKGWFAVHEGTRLETYVGGDMVGRVQLPEQAKKLTTINAGVIGCDPARHRQVIEKARQWKQEISSCIMGDQGLLNLAWYDLRRSLPPSDSNDFNGGYHAGGRIDLTNAILHIAGPHLVDQVRQTGKTRPQLQRELWQQWPRGLAMRPIDRTDFWRQTLPHPWPWLNQCTAGRYRPFVEKMRRASLQLLGHRDALLVRSAPQAHLLDTQVLRQIEQRWAGEVARLKPIHYVPLYHLASGGQLTCAWPRRFRRWADHWLSRVR